MSEKSSDESIERIVAERLDSIFGDDEEEEAVLPPPAPAKPSPLSKMQEAVEALHAGITPHTVENVASEFRSLGKTLGEEPLFRPLLKIAGMLIGTLRSGGESARRDAMNTMTSVADCMKTLAEDESLPVSQKRTLVQREIEAFKAFRESIQEKPPAPEPAPTPPPEAAPETPAPEPAPASPPEPTPETPAPEPAPASPPEPTPETPAPEPAPASVSKAPQEDLGEAHAAEPRSPGADRSREALRKLQVWIGKEMSDVKNQIQEVKAALPDHAPSQTDPPEELAQIAADIKNLSGVPQSLKMLQTQMLSALVSLKKSMDALPKPSTDQEPVREGVREELEMLRKSLEPVLQIPAGIQKLEKETRDALKQMSEKVSSMQQQFDSLREAVRATRLDLNRLRSFAEDSSESRSPLEPHPHESVPPEEEDDLTLDSTYGHLEWEQIGPQELQGEGVAEEEPQMEASPARKEPSESQAGSASSLPSGQYFLFYTGGRKYAVDARYVIKSTRIGGAIAKKARSNGNLTLVDVKSVLSSPRKGIEPAWEKLSDQEIKQMTYALVPDQALDGLAATNGGGALFLGTEEKSLLILSDEPAVKVTLSVEDEIQMTTSSDTSQSATCGSILRSGEGAEFYLILAPEHLAGHLA